MLEKSDKFRKAKHKALLTAFAFMQHQNENLLPFNGKLVAAFKSI